MSQHMEDAACNARNDLVVIQALAEALAAKLEDMNFGVDRTSPNVQAEDTVMTLAYAVTSRTEKALDQVVDRIAKHDAEESK